MAEYFWLITTAMICCTVIYSVWKFCKTWKDIEDWRCGIGSCSVELEEKRLEWQINHSCGHEGHGEYYSEESDN